MTAIISNFNSAYRGIASTIFVTVKEPHIAVFANDLVGSSIASRILGVGHALDINSHTRSWRFCGNFCENVANSFSVLDLLP